MNYIAEIKAFYDLVMTNQLSTGQIALWHALMHINNKCAWQGWFSVPNLTLELHTGMSRQGIQKARNTLKQKGIIDFNPNGTKATTYRLLSMSTGFVSGEKNISDMSNSFQVGCQDGFQDSFQVGCQDGSTLNKPNQTKPNIKDANASSSLNHFDENSDEMKLAMLLFGRMRKNNPTCKEPNFQSWCKHVDLMLRVDKRTPKEIQDIIVFSQRDSFWMGNILSTKKLREKFDQLTAKMKAPPTGKTNVLPGGSSYDLSELEKAIEGDI